MSGEDKETRVVDENLRLVLSKGHDEWLVKEHSAARGRLHTALMWSAVAFLMIPGSAALAGLSPPAGILLFFLSVFVLIFALREIFISARRIREVSGYAGGHKDFLRKYNRP